MKVRRQRKDSVMDASIGVNLRVTAHSNQGGRKYMEDMFCVAYQPTSDEKDLLYAYFGIFDGHGGREAALYAKTHLMDHIVSQKNFWSDEDDLVLRAIRDGFISVHQAMWRELDKWPKTQSGLPSTSGTTASVAFVRRGKLYIGHVGDSGIVMGYKDPQSNYWKAKPLTNDHKPESPVEMARIRECGGKVVNKSGVPRVVWNRPRIGHKGPVRRSTLIDEIPFLAVARSLGDLWSYNSEQNEFVVSPVPDTSVIEIDVNSHRCLILGSDGLWNMLSAQDAVNSVYFAEKSNEHQQLVAATTGAPPDIKANWMNPSKRLVDRALDRWYMNALRADNTSVVTVVIDPPGPPKVQQLTPAQKTSSFKAVYTRYPTPPRNECVSPQPREGSPAYKSRSSSEKLESMANINKDNRSERLERRKKPRQKVSSKTSRVLAKTPQRLDESVNQPSSSPSYHQFSHSHVATVETDSDVQINEISSSCESLKTDGADCSSQGAAPPDGKRGKGRRPPAKAKLSTTVPLKRASRQSEVTEEEPASQRKIRKTDYPPQSSRRSVSRGKKVLTEIVPDRSVTRQQNKKVIGKVALPTKKTMGTRGSAITSLRNNKGKNDAVGTSPRQTRGSPSKDASHSHLLTENSSDPSYDRPIERLQQLTSKLPELATPSPSLSPRSQRSGRTGRKDGDCQTPVKGKPQRAKAALSPDITMWRVQQLNMGPNKKPKPLSLEMSLPIDFYRGRRSEAPKPEVSTLKRLKGKKPTPREVAPLIRSDRKAKVQAAEKVAKSRVTRSKNK